MDELELDSRYREWFEAWGKEANTVAVLGSKKWPKKDRDIQVKEKIFAPPLEK